MRTIISSLNILNLILYFLIGTLLLHLTYSWADQRPKAQDNEAIQSVVKAFVTAWNHDDADALVKLFVRNGILNTPTEADAESRSAIRKLLTQDREDLFQDSNLTKDIRKIQFQGAGRAIAEGHYELVGIEHGMGLLQVSVKGEYTFYLEKHNGAWLIKKCDIRRSD